MTGFININKAEGVSSAREVAIIKRLTHCPCGHMGTLDPMASGVLPIGIGNACRLFDYFLDKHKVYSAKFKFGVDYDTLDITGNCLSDGGRIPSAREIEDILPLFTGKIMQTPPRYSAKSINGVKGYKLARAGVEFEPAPKEVNIYSVKLLSCDGDEYSFEIECGGGTYIRSLGRDIAAKLGTVAAMSSLVRLSSGVFKIEKSVRSSNLDELNIADYIIPTESVLPFGSIYPKGADAKKLFNGIPVPADAEDGLYKIYNEDGCFYGLGAVNGGSLKVRTKLC